jgi:cytochrome c-type biogenesis protein CcmE
MNTYWKFGAILAVIIGVLVWLAMDGVTKSKTYYKEIREVNQMGDRAQGQRLRVNGYVEQGSILRDGSKVSFILHQNPSVLRQDPVRLAVVYNGIDPLPDTFKDNAQAMADGKVGQDGVFHASKVQAKCASKYESKPQMKTGAKWRALPAKAIHTVAIAAERLHAQAHALAELTTDETAHAVRLPLCGAHQGCQRYAGMILFQ